MVGAQFRGLRVKGTPAFAVCQKGGRCTCVPIDHWGWLKVSEWTLSSFTGGLLFLFITNQKGASIDSFSTLAVNGFSSCLEAGIAFRPALTKFVPGGTAVSPLHIWPVRNAHSRQRLTLAGVKPSGLRFQQHSEFIRRVAPYRGSNCGCSVMQKTGG